MTKPFRGPFRRIESQHSSRRHRGPARGFSLVEVSLASALLSLLVLMVSGAWTGLGRPSADAVIRCRVAQEANLALESLARDLGGSLAEEPTGAKEQGRLVGRLAAGRSRLLLCFDGSPLNETADWNSPDTVITYHVQDGQLIRSNLLDRTSTAVAENVDRMRLVSRSDRLTINLTLTYRDITRTYTIVARDP